MQALTAEGPDWNACSEIQRSTTECRHYDYDVVESLFEAWLRFLYNYETPQDQLLSL